MRTYKICAARVNARLLMVMLVAILMILPVTANDICSKMPSLSAPEMYEDDNNENGHVQDNTVYMILAVQGSCLSCVAPLNSLAKLVEELNGEGVSVKMLGINRNVWHSRLLLSYLRKRVIFPVQQDTTSTTLYQQMQMKRGDVLIYDKCSRLVEHVKGGMLLPNDVHDAVLKAHEGQVCSHLHKQMIPSSRRHM